MIEKVGADLRERASLVGIPCSSRRNRQRNVVSSASLRGSFIHLDVVRLCESILCSRSANVPSSPNRPRPPPTSPPHLRNPSNNEIGLTEHVSSFSRSIGAGPACSSSAIAIAVPRQESRSPTAVTALPQVASVAVHDSMLGASGGLVPRRTISPPS